MSWKPTEEFKQMMRIRMSGKNNPFYGKKHKKELIEKLSNERKGPLNSMYGKTKEEFPTLSHLGELNPRFGKKNSIEANIKTGLASKLRNQGINHPMHGRKHSEETKIKCGIINIGKSPSLETREKLRQATIKSLKSGKHFSVPNKEEINLLDIVNKLNLPYKYVGDGKETIEDLSPDFINANGEKKVIEYNGCFVHRCKKCFPNGSKKFFKKTERKLTQEQREQLYNYYGYKCLTIWRHDLESGKAEEMLKTF